MGYLLRYQSEFTELAKSRFLDCDSCGMTQGALIRNVADRQALYMQAKQPRSDILYMTTLDTGRCSHQPFVEAGLRYTMLWLKQLRIWDSNIGAPTCRPLGLKNWMGDAEP